MTNKEYIDTDDYNFENEILNDKIHKWVFSILMLLFLLLTVCVYLVSTKDNNDMPSPKVYYLIYCVLVVGFYYNYYRISVYITNFISLFYDIKI